MFYRLARIRTAIGNDTVSVFNSNAFCYSRNFHEDVSNTIRVCFVYFISRANVSFRNNKKMNCSLRIYILESIYFLSCLKTPRTSNYTELINFDEEYTEIKADLIKSAAELKQ